MTVKELMKELSYLDEDTKIFIGQYQDYGSDFVYGIESMEEGMGVNKFYGSGLRDVALIILGSQIGVIDSDPYIDEDEEKEE